LGTPRRAHRIERQRVRAVGDRRFHLRLLLGRVTDAMVTLHQRYHHRAPVTAKTVLLGGDLLACVLGGVYTDVEKTMIELQRTTIV
jgi:hypothetical protein